MPKKKPPNIEETFSNLEAIVTRLESEQTDLQGSLEAFEQGIGEIKAAQKLLSEASQRVTHLVESDREASHPDQDAADE